MKGKEHLTRPEQFTRVYNEGISRSDSYLVMRALPNGLEFSRYGISVSKRVGKAVIRNRVKRVLREILRLTAYKQGWDLVLIARSRAAAAGYGQLDESVQSLLSRSNLKVQ